MRSNRRLRLAIAPLAIGLVLLPTLAYAQGTAPAADPHGLNQTYNAAFQVPPPKDSPEEPLLAQTIGKILGWFMGLLGFIFLMIIIYGGIGWMTAGGSEERVEKAKHQINAAIAGLIVTFISYALAEAIVIALGLAAGT